MRKHLKNDQSGLASIVIAIIVVIILSTLILGFMQISRRESRRSLDRELSANAFYAAESGINDAVKAVTQQGFNGDKTQCKPFDVGAGPAALSGKSNMLTADGNIKYPCLLIDQTPGSIEYKSVSTDHSRSFPIAAANGDNVTAITLTWRSTVDKYDLFRPAAVKDFPPNGASWNSTGLLRVDIVPGDSLDRAGLVSNAKTFFLYPNTSNGPPPGVVNFSASQSGEIVSGQCAGVGNAAQCSVRLTNLPAGVGTYYGRVLAMYSDVQVTVAADSTNAGTGVVTANTKLQNAQVKIESTGEAADVTRNVEVRIPRDNSDLPDFAIASMDSLCKKFLILPSGVFTDGGIDNSCNLNQVTSP